jgi:hypothetical protein
MALLASPSLRELSEKTFTTNIEGYLADRVTARTRGLRAQKL